MKPTDVKNNTYIDNAKNNTYIDIDKEVISIY